MWNICSAKRQSFIILYLHLTSSEGYFRLLRLTSYTSFTLMRKILMLFMAGLLSLASLKAQKADGSITGKLTDTAAKQPLSGATVSLLNAKDSSLVTFTLTNKQGVFEIKGLEAGDYQLVISFQGYQTIKKKTAISATDKLIDLHDVSVQKDYKTLGEVVINNDAPVIIKE